ncbi:hypothetical protein [Thiofilum flexile]|uniref:hypothetical protein n=1 Tax=Thiofilum flexile TaxID=125627 RepID=UPI00036E8D69|nr:hypothetical protein [Thiofilum flexile]
MPSHFSTIGFPIESAEELYDIAEKVSHHAERLECANGYYLKWSSPEGAELWLQVDKENNLVGLVPTFSGESNMSVGVMSEIVGSDDTPFDGSIHGWADPSEDNPESGAYPFVFDLVNKAIYGTLDFPFISEVSLSAFAHELTVYDSEAEYDSSQTKEPKFSVESFIPSGLFIDKEDPKATPRPYAVFTGTVLKEKECTNPLTNNNYHWALVKTLGGTIDVVTDLELVQKPIKVGSVISGSFWLSGKIKNPRVTVKKGFLGGLFSKKT